MTDTDLVTQPAGETPSPSQDAAAAAPRRRGGLTGMVLADLRALAADIGIGDTAGMRKGDLIVAIKDRQAGGSPRATTTGSTGSAATGAGGAGAGSAASGPSASSSAEPVSPATDERPPADTRAEGTATPEGGEDVPRRARQRRGASRGAGAPEATPRADETAPADAGPAQRTDDAAGSDAQPDRAGARGADDADRGRGRGRAEPAPDEQDRTGGERDGAGAPDEGGRSARGRSGGQRNAGQNGGGQQDAGRNGAAQNGRTQGAGRDDAGQDDRKQDDRKQDDRKPDDAGQAGGQGPRQDRGAPDDETDGRGRRGRRFRERRRGRDRGPEGAGGGGTSSDEREPEVTDDDVLQPVAGILDVLDNYAFVRTSGYLAGEDDVYVSLGMVRKNGLRRGDAVTGAVRVPREGEQSGGRGNQKFNPLVRIDSINGGDADAARKRPEFGKLTPLYPNQRLRLETTPNILTTRVIDLVMPIGKGQRALIVSPPKAGKTSVLQAIANAITVNNPECHLMVVLVDERPEEVTDMQRSVRGEVISSTFDRPPGDHTAVAELAIERAKRLVEGGKDVVVLLDSITRLGRAYNNSSPASGRILSGGVDSTALYPPKRFLGAARNIEHGGSLTIIATAMVETGSTGDTVIFEEFKGTGNAELKLDRKIAERRVFPAVDVNPSGTRKDELLLGADEYAVTLKLRRVLSGLDPHQAIDLLIDRLRKSHSNAEFLMQVSKTSPSPAGARDDES